MKILGLSYLLLAGLALAAEPVALPLELGTLTTVGTGSRTYDGVKIIGRDAVGVKISHEGGTSRIAYEKLPPDLRQRFSVDPEAAKAQLRKEADERAGHDRAVEEGLKAAGEPGMKPEVVPLPTVAKAGPGDVESDEAFIARLTQTNLPDASGKTRMERITALRAYLIALRKQEEKMEEEFERRGEMYSRRIARNSEKQQHFMLNLSERLEELHQKQQAVARQIADRIRAAEIDLISLEQGG